MPGGARLAADRLLFSFLHHTRIAGDAETSQVAATTPAPAVGKAGVRSRRALPLVDTQQPLDGFGALDVKD